MDYVTEEGAPAMQLYLLLDPVVGQKSPVRAPRTLDTIPNADVYLRNHNVRTETAW